MLYVAVAMARRPLHTPQNKSPFGNPGPGAVRPLVHTQGGGGFSVMWLVVIVLLVLGGILVYTINSQEPPPAPAAPAKTPTKAQRPAAEDEELRVVAEEEDALPAGGGAAATAPKKQDSPGKQPKKSKKPAVTTPEPEEETPAADDTPSATEEEPETPAADEPEEDETPATAAEDAAGDEDAGDEDAATAEGESPLRLDPAADADPACAAQYDSLVQRCLKEQEYLLLRDTLREALKSAYPKAFENAAAAAEKAAASADEDAPATPYDAIPAASAYAKVDGKLGKRALAAYYCLELALAEGSEPASDEDAAFLQFLLTDKSSPSADFFKGVQKKKVASAVAAEMLGELKSLYEENPKKAAKSIPSITASAGKMALRKYYPVDKKEMEKTIAGILKTKPTGGANADQQEAINLCNVYRYVCGVAPTLKHDKTFAAQAQEAAAACAKAGRIAHDLDHFTDACNLHQGSNTCAASVSGYISDPGDHNRKARGHRNWILDPAAAKTAFGISGVFGAMRVMDHSSTVKQKMPYSYPGRGYFPVRYMHGDGWSYHAGPAGAVGADAKVEMWRLLNTPKKPVTQSDLSSSRAIEVKEVFVNGNYLVFEPDYDDSAFKRKADGSLDGVYWIRVTWKGYKDEYLVEFY